MLTSRLLLVQALFLATSTDLVVAQSRPNPPARVTPWTPRSPKPASPETVRMLAPVPAVTSNSWTLIGPQPLNSNGANGNVSGRVTGIAVDPTNANILYITPAGGGVWKTTNGGGSWTPLTDAQTTLSMGSIAIAPNNASVIYAGTGESNNALDSNFGRGILVSTNGGASWTLRTGPAGIFNTSRLTIGRIAVDPTNSAIAYAAAASFGNNGGCCGTGIYRTTDTGATWTNMTQAAGLDSNNPWSDVQLDTTSPTTIYAAHGNNFGDAANGVYKSTNSGTTWALQAGFPSGSTVGRIALAVSGQVVYAAAQDPATATFGALLYIRRSDNGGTASTNLTGSAGMGNYMGGQGWYDNVVTVDPANSAIVIVAGAAGGGSILRSTDSGANWSDISGGAVNPHADHHAGAFVGGLYLDGCDGGIYRLDDAAGPKWTNLNADLATIQFTGLGLHPTDPKQVIGGSQDNGTERFTGDSVWSETDGGDGGYAKFSQTNGNIAYHQIPVASFGNNFFRWSSDSGATWSTRTSSISADAANQQFYAPFVVDPGNGDRVLYGTNGIWETTNQGAAWAKLGAFPVAGGFVNAIGLAPSTTQTIYAAVHSATGANAGFGPTNVFVTTNHGTSWTNITAGLPAGALVQDIQVDPATSTTAYAVVNSFSGSGNVFRTTNGGTTWTNISGNLSSVTACLCSTPVWSLQIGTPAGVLYIGAEDGVYVTADTGTTWARLSTGLPNAQAVQIELNKTLNILGVSTHGRSVWEISVAAVLPDLTLTKTHPAGFAQGQVGAQYTILVKNVGAGPTTGVPVTVTDTLPPSMTATAMSGAGWTCTLATLTCTSTAIVAGGANFNPITLTVTIAPNAPANVLNSAVLTGGGDANGANNFVDDPTTIIQLPDLILTKSHVGSFTQGQLGATYTVIVSNIGFGPTTGAPVFMTDTVPTGLTVVAMTGAGWTCNVVTVTCSSTAIVPTGSSFPPITVTVNVATDSPLNVINNVAVAGGGELAVFSGNNTAADPTKILPLDFLIRYAANLTSGDAVINITNTGFNGAALTGPGFGGAVGNICMNVYAFSPDEQLISCCSCLITPNGLVSISVNSDLISNTLTGVRPNSVVVKLVNTGAGTAFTGTTCTNSAALAGTVAFPTAGGSLAFGTTMHAGAAAGTLAVAETPFLRATLSPAELASITNRCTNIVGNGSTFGICRSCRTSGLNSGR